MANNAGPSIVTSASSASSSTSSGNLVPPPGFAVVLDFATAVVTNAGADSESVAIELTLGGSAYRITQRATSAQTVTVHAEFPGGLTLGPGTKTVVAKSYTTTATAAASPTNLTINVGYHFEAA